MSQMLFRSAARSAELRRGEFVEALRSSSVQNCRRRPPVAAGSRDSNAGRIAKSPLIMQTSPSKASSSTAVVMFDRNSRRAPGVERLRGNFLGEVLRLSIMGPANSPSIHLSLLGASYDQSTPSSLVFGVSCTRCGDSLLRGANVCSVARLERAVADRSAEQKAAWTAPKADVPADLVTATTRLFQQGLADPRGCDYRTISVGTGSCWSGDAGVAECHGWVLPAAEKTAQRFAGMLERHGLSCRFR